ncbi:glutamate--cysteine ligase [Yunchengibacter salinarum]|uniref:glutamate--cysteine ligase n=1 Tax=Yunchengibacter salinarum TaxID=3133399 RepID=UPI0035B58E1C
MDTSHIIEDKTDLVAHLERGSLPDPADWRIGSEHEKFVFHQDTLAPLAYEGSGDRPGIRDVLQAFAERGFEPVTEDGKLIAAKQNGASITLEPGGQFELSGAPLVDLHQTCAETSDHLHIAKEIGETLGVGFLGLGFHPTLKREDVPVMPKGRYDIMRAYMPKRGTLGLDMMLRTCTVQVNLDFADESDMVKKFRIGLALQPLTTALFANSPFKEGRPSGLRSLRSQVWTDTDPDRTGMLPFVFEDGFGFERYIDYVLDVPMYFIQREGRFIDCSGQSFRDFMAGKLPAWPGEKPTLKDFDDHLTTIFPEVRLKTFLEMRGADGGPWSRLCALPALWVGLLYDRQAQDAAWDLVKDWTDEERETMRADVPRLGLATEIRGENFQDLSRRVLTIAEGGLKRRGFLSSEKEDETAFLHSLWLTVENGESPADTLLRKFHTDWGGDVTRVFRECNY